MSDQHFVDPIKWLKLKKILQFAILTRLITIIKLVKIANSKKKLFLAILSDQQSVGRSLP